MPPVFATCQESITSQDGLTGSAWGDWANYTASPLRAFENELGVQAVLSGSVYARVFRILTIVLFLGFQMSLVLSL